MGKWAQLEQRLGMGDSKLKEEQSKNTCMATRLVSSREDEEQKGIEEKIDGREGQE